VVLGCSLSRGLASHMTAQECDFAGPLLQLRSICE
jgi:hypothetical protein